MKDTCFIVVNKKDVVKMYKTPPPLKPNEISLKCVVALPNHLFEDSTIEVKLEVPMTFDKKIKQFEFELKELKGRM